jgi:DNA excision repair protein ERCC-2
MKPVVVPLREFAVPAPRTGSLEARSGYGRAAAEGREIHGRVQKNRAKSLSQYQAELPVSGVFERDGYRFQVDGRMDGLFRTEPPRIEEIKTSPAIRDLAVLLAENPYTHPYGLQLLTYGYLYWREHLVLPHLTFHLVATRSRDACDLGIELDVIRYEQWLQRRLAELVATAQQDEKRAARRKNIAASLVFPFPAPRSGQAELMQEIAAGLTEHQPLLLQAPTGLGKTVGVLYPVMKDALGRGQRVVYVTPKNSQHAVAEEAVVRFQEAGSPVKALTITAKQKICFKDEPLCRPDYCEFARDYYDKLHDHGLLELLARKKKLTARTFRTLGTTYEICPFALQIECVGAADLVICDYNYAFAPRSALGGLPVTGLDQIGRPNLVIDEAHNLPARAMDYYSPEISAGTLAALRDGMDTLPPRVRDEARELLDDCLQAILACGIGQRSPHRIEPPLASFQEQDARMRAFLARYLDGGATVTPDDVLLRLANSWASFTEALELAADPKHPEFFTTFHPQQAGGTVAITCCDASAFLKECYQEYQQVVGFSATLKPFDYYVKLSGFDQARTRTVEFTSPFPREHRKILIIPQVSTRYTQRSRNYARIAEALQRITALRPGNYFVFFPSFEFLEQVAALFVPPDGFMVLRQERAMRESALTAILDQLRCREVPTVVMAVQGGSLAEGLDYAGEMVIGAFVVGPPLPTYDLERELMRKYYQKQYGAGFAYAYTIPAMAKAVQAAGRVIRSETDRGLIVLLDERFVQESYSRSLPRDWFDRDVTELVSTAILQDVAEFWSQ